MDMRKLREIVVMSQCSNDLALRVYETSAEFSLELGEWAEFAAAANRLTLEYYGQDTFSRWASCALFLFYGSSLNTFEDMNSLLRRIKGDIPWLNDSVELLFAIRSGNIPQFDKAAGNLPKMPRKFIEYIKSFAISTATDHFKKAYKDFPESFHTSLLGTT
jgi:hypothetical protein